MRALLLGLGHPYIALLGIFINERWRPKARVAVIGFYLSLQCCPDSLAIPDLAFSVHQHRPRFSLTILPLSFVLAFS